MHITRQSVALSEKRRTCQLSVSFKLLLCFVGILSGSLGGGVHAQQLASNEAPDLEPAVQLSRFEYRQIVMGMEARLVLYAASETLATQASRQAFETLHAADKTFSNYRIDSELAQLVAAAGQAPLEISEPLFRVLSVANAVRQASAGAFDVSAAPLIELWRHARRVGRPPDADALELAVVELHLGELQLEQAARSALETELIPAPRARLSRAGMALDLGGIAKGFACDQALESLSQAGIESALVEVGGDLVVSGPPPGRGAWLIEVGCGEGALPPTRLAVVHTAVSTSGDTEQHFVHNGVRYSHVIDPRNGQALSDRRCVTLIADRGVWSDSLASACRVLGPQAGAALVAQLSAKHSFKARLLIDGQALLQPAAELTPGPWIALLADFPQAWEAVDSEGEVHSPAAEMLRGGVLEIPSTPPSGWLRTRADYRDFQLRLDVKLARMANGGLFLRAARDGSNPSYSGCEVQLLDDFNWETQTNTTLRDWQFTGSLYGAVAPNDRAAFGPLGTWNSFEVLYVGTQLSVMLNGRLLYDVDTHALDVDPAFAQRAARGALGLQRYAAPLVSAEVAVSVRNLFLREL